MNQKYKTAVILSSMSAFHLINNYVWLKINKSFLIFDSAVYYLFSLRVYDVLKDILCGTLSLFKVIEIFKFAKWHGIFVSSITAPFYFLFGASENTAIMVNNAIFLIILIVSVYGIGRTLHSRRAGVLGSFIVTAYPVIFFNLRTYMLDVPLTAAVALSVYALLRTDNFRNKKYSLLFALAAGAGLLIKFNYAIFAAGPLGIILYRAFIAEKGLRKRNQEGGRAVKNFILIFIITIFIFVFFYIFKFKDIFYRIWDTSCFRAFEENYFLSLFDFIKKLFCNLWIYFQALITQSVSPFFSLVFFIGFIFYVKLKSREQWLLFFPIIIPFLFISILFYVPPGLMLRYLMPSLPFAALISSIGISSVRHNALRRAGAGLIIFYGIFNFFSISHNLNSLPQEKIGGICVVPMRTFYYSYISFENIKKTLEQISKLGSDEEWKQILFLDNLPEIFFPLENIVFREKKHMDIYRVSLDPESQYKKEDISFLGNVCLKADYVIVKDNIDTEARNDLYFVKEQLDNARSVFYKNINNFELIKKMPLAYKNNLLIYRNKLLNDAVAAIEQGSLKLIFDKGKGRIFWNGNELTQGLCLYASVFANGCWRDSPEAVCNIVSADRNKIIAQGNWMHLPISQTWRLELKEGNIIEWEADMWVYQEIEIEAEHSKLMLSDRYKKWFAGDNESGEFDTAFANCKWVKMWGGDIKNEIGVQAGINKENALPSLAFKSCLEDGRYRCVIENSSRTFRGRAIGLYKVNKGKNKLVPAGEYKYF